jgi:hypothetical protein
VRCVIRIALVIGLLNHLIAFIAQTAGPLAPGLQIFFSTFEFVVQVIGLAGGLAQLIYLKKLAMRIPDPSLSDRANTLVWGFSISNGGMLAFFYIPLLIMTRSGKLIPGAMGSSMMFFGCSGAVFGLVAVVFGFMYLFMLSRFGRAFDEQIALARQVWSHPRPGNETRSGLPS